MYLRQNEKGSTIVIVALAMVVFLGLLAFVTDVGLAYLKRARLQNAMDAAVMAAAQELPADTTRATAMARSYAQSNGVDPDSLIISIGSNNTEITVESTYRVQFNFAQILGIDEANVSVQSGAKVAPVNQVTGVVPLAIEEQTFNFGSLYTLKIAHPDNGWCGALALGGNGANTYEDNLANGYNQVIKIGDVLETKTGNMSGPTQDGIQARFDRETHSPPCTATNFTRDCPRLVTLPVVRTNTDGGQVKYVTVVGFASFLIEKVPGNGNDSIITGYFVKSLLNASTDNSQTDFGLYGVKLNR